MFVYLINILSICVYGLIFCTDGLVFKKGQSVALRKLAFMSVSFAQCAVIACMRFDIGTDYRWYAYGFNSMAQTGFSTLKYEDWEPGFVLLNKIVALFTKDVTVFIGICAIISLSGMFYLIWRFSKNPFMSVFLFLNTYLFYLDMDFVRQSIAMSILCFAYGFMRDKKVWQYMLLCALAVMFHYTALYMVPVIFITYIKINLKTLPIYAVAVILYFSLSDMVLKLVLSVIYKEYDGTRFIEHGVYWFYAIYPVLISIAAVSLVFYLKFEIPKHLNMLLHMMLLMGFWQIVMTKHSIFERFSYYTMSFIVIAVPEMIAVFKDKYSERRIRSLEERFGDDKKGLSAAKKRSQKQLTLIVSGISTGVLILTFAYNMLGLIHPKDGVHGVVPYQSRYLYNPHIFIDDLFKG